MRASPSARGNGDQRRHDDGESPSRALLRQPARKTRADGGGRETCASEGQPPEVCARSRRRGPPPPTPAPANSRKARELALIHSQGEARGWAWKRAGTLMGENEELGKPGQLDVGLPGEKKKRHDGGWSPASCCKEPQEAWSPQSQAPPQALLVLFKKCETMTGNH